MSDWCRWCGFVALILCGGCSPSPSSVEEIGGDGGQERVLQSEWEGRVENEVDGGGVEFRQELQGLEKKHLGRIRKEILEVAQEIGQEGNYLLIMENVGVLYSPNSIDITDSLIKKYNAAQQAKAKKE